MNANANRQRRGPAVLGRRIALTASVAAVAATLTVSAAPASYAAGWGESVRSYLSPSPVDSGGSDSSVVLTHPDVSIDPAAVFHARDEKLTVRSAYSQDHSWVDVQVRVYRHADADGMPYDLVETDDFRVQDGHREYELGTPDGTGNIPEGYYVAIRASASGHFDWSQWAYARA